jgi:hypothetical protein
MRILAGLIVGVALFAAPSRATETGDPPAPKAEILGLWKGKSVCTKAEGTEFCRDETVVYHFVDVPSREGTVALKAARVVDGTLQRTYELYFTYRPETREWTCEFEQGKTRAVWSYVVGEDALTGNAAVLPARTIVRTVSATRTSRDEALNP